MKKISLSLMALAALAASNIAAAQVSTPFYAGLQVGTSRSNLDCSGFSDCKKSDTGVKVYGGYKVTPEWAAELSYADLGKVKATMPGASGEWKANSFGLGAAYHAAFNSDWSGVARFGIASTEVKFNGVGTTVPSASERKTEPYLGLGVGYAVNKQVTLTGNWDWNQGKILGETYKSNLFSVGVAFSF